MLGSANEHRKYRAAMVFAAVRVVAVAAAAALIPACGAAVDVGDAYSMT